MFFRKWEKNVQSALLILTVVFSSFVLAEEIILEPDDAEWYSSYGMSVAASDDYMVVGDPGEEVVYVYAQTNGNWVLETKLAGPAQTSDFDFGSVVALSGDDIVVGAHNANPENGQGYQGCVYVFSRDSLTSLWTETQILTGSNIGEGDHFGWSVAVVGDQLAVSAYKNWDTDGDNTIDEVYLFEKQNGVWEEVSILTAADPSENGGFGKAIAISDSFVVVGAMYEENQTIDGSTAYKSGSVYVYGDEKQWVLTEADPIKYNNFGTSVAMAGSYLAVGAIGTSTSTGKVYVYHFEGEEWVEKAVLEPSESEDGGDFGFTLAMSEDYIVVGTNISPEGVAYVYKRSGDNWNETKRLQASEPESYDRFGRTVAISGEIALIGSSGSDKAFVFDLNEFISPIISMPKDVSFTYSTIRISDNSFVLSLDLDRYEMVSVAIYNVEGEVVKNILHNTLSIGSHNITIDGNLLSTGSYFLNAVISGKLYSQKISITK